MMCYYIYVLVCFTHGYSYSGKIFEVFKLLSCDVYIEICSRVNKCMILFQRFIIPAVSIPVYIQSSAAGQTNTL